MGGDDGPGFRPHNRQYATRQQGFTESRVVDGASAGVHESRSISEGLDGSLKISLENTANDQQPLDGWIPEKAYPEKEPHFGGRQGGGARGDKQPPRHQQQRISERTGTGLQNTSTDVFQHSSVKAAENVATSSVTAVSREAVNREIGSWEASDAVVTGQEWETSEPENNSTVVHPALPTAKPTETDDEDEQWEDVIEDEESSDTQIDHDTFQDSNQMTSHNRPCICCVSMLCWFLEKLPCQFGLRHALAQTVFQKAAQHERRMRHSCTRYETFYSE